jgi:hypothetical protein
MIQNKTIHYWKLGRDELLLLLARRNPEIQEIKDHQKETNVSCRQDGATFFVQCKKCCQYQQQNSNNNNKYILFLLYINLTNVQINNI